MQQHGFNMNRIKKGVHHQLECRMAAGGVGGAYGGMATGGQRGSGRSSELAAVSDGELSRSLAALGALGFHVLHHLDPLHHLPEHDVLPIEPAGRHTVNTRTTPGNIQLVFC